MKTWILLFLTLLLPKLSWALDNCVPQIDSTPEIVHCKMSLGDYPRPLHFFIPTNLSDSENLKILLHFHGHNIRGYDHFYHTKNSGEGYGDYAAFLLTSKVNGVVIVPESLGNCATYDNFFNQKDRTEKFFNSLKNTLSQLNSDQELILSGHSGAYRVLNRLAGYANQQNSGLSNLKGIGLFDATYGAIPNIISWVKIKNEIQDDFIFYNAYVSGKKATAEEGSLSLKKELKNLDSKRIFFSAIDGVDSEALLLQHFNSLNRGSLVRFWQNI